MKLTGRSMEERLRRETAAKLRDQGVFGTPGEKAHPTCFAFCITRAVMHVLRLTIGSVRMMSQVRGTRRQDYGLRMLKKLI